MEQLKQELLTRAKQAFEVYRNAGTNLDQAGALAFDEVDAEAETLTDWYRQELYEEWELFLDGQAQTATT